MLQEKKALIAGRLKKTMDKSNAMMCEINDGLERIIRDNESLVTFGRVFEKWVDKVSRM